MCFLTRNYQLFQELLTKAEDKSDVEVAEARMEDPNQELVLLRPVLFRIRTVACYSDQATFSFNYIR